MKKLLPIFMMFCLMAIKVDLSLGQSCANLDIQWQADIASSCNKMVMTMLHDKNGKPYLYVANKEAGLIIYDITSPTTPKAMDTVPIHLHDTLEVMNLEQEGDYIYLAIGNHFTNPQKGGMAIVDVSDPENAEMTDLYVVPGSSSGAGIVKVEGNYAYLGAMQSGVAILDITDKDNISFVSQYVPNINYPVTNPNPALYNARGMEVRNGIVYLCHDAGGLRIINCQDKQNPKETGRYANPATYVPFNRPRAYNNIVLDDSIAYVSVDYCGLEALNISDTGNIKLAGWWNPYDCPNNNWFTSPSHTNELYLDKNCKTLFVSTGKSDLMVLDVSNPTQPDSCSFYGGVSNNTGTWGVSGYEGQVYLSYICALIPFASNWTGVKILTYNACSSTGLDKSIDKDVVIFPNPTSDAINISGLPPGSNNQLVIYNSLGQKVMNTTSISGQPLRIDVHTLPEGLYFLSIGNGLNVEKILISR